VIVVLLGLFWPRDLSGQVRRIGFVFAAAIVLFFATAVPSLVLTREFDQASAAKLHHLADSNGELRAQLTDATGRLDAANVQVEALSRSSSQERRISAERQAALEKQLGTIASSAEKVGRILKLQFGEALVTFEPGKKELTCESKERLSRVVGYLSRDIAGIEKITIIGHTDLTGSPDFNEHLAVDRAAEVEQYLKNAGIPSDLLAPPEGRSFRQPFGFSTVQPRDVIERENETAEEKARNRRVQMNILEVKPNPASGL
jgi:outer membrane protein OmpA-like peptidoglycan-associated protein